MSSRAAAVIVHYGDASVTARAVAATLRVAGLGEVLVVDNGGDPVALAAALRRRTAGVRGRRVQLVPMAGNAGFARGANAGMRAALRRGASYVWLLNNDATPAPGALSPLVRALQADPRAGIAGSLVLDDDRPPRIWHGGGTIDLATGLTVSRGAGDRRLGRFTAVEPVAWVTGCSLLARAALIRATGGIDERFVMYYEETDWCLRAARKGWRTLFCPASRVTHHVAGREARRADGWLYWETRNRLLLLRRHAPARVLPAALGMLRWPLGSALLRGRLGGAWAALRGFAAFSRLARSRPR